MWWSGIAIRSWNLETSSGLKSPGRTPLGFLQCLSRLEISWSSSLHSWPLSLLLRGFSMGVFSFDMELKYSAHSSAISWLFFPGNTDPIFQGFLPSFVFKLFWRSFLNFSRPWLHPLLSQCRLPWLSWLIIFATRLVSFAIALNYFGLRNNTQYLYLWSRVE